MIQYFDLERTGWTMIGKESVLFLEEITFRRFIFRLCEIKEKPKRCE